MREDLAALQARHAVAMAAQHLNHLGFSDFAEIPVIDDNSAQALEFRIHLFEVIFQRARTEPFPSASRRQAADDVDAADVDPHPRSRIRVATDAELREVEALAGIAEAALGEAS